MNGTLRLATRIRSLNLASRVLIHQFSRKAVFCHRNSSLNVAPASIFRNYCKVHTPPEESLMDQNLYDSVCSETLEELGDYFEEVLENTSILDSIPDVTFSDGVLTVKISDIHGTYVINRQSPNRQIWLSSPQSGPKRFDYVPSSDNEQIGKWVYKHSGEGLHELLQAELSPILTDVELDFLKLIHSGKAES